MRRTQAIAALVSHSAGAITVTTEQAIGAWRAAVTEPANQIPDHLDIVGCMGSATQCATPLEQASPSDHVGPGTAPMALFNSNKEVIPQSQAQDMDHTLSQSAVPQQVTIIQGVRHSFAYANSVMPAAIAFLHTWLG